MPSDIMLDRYYLLTSNEIDNEHGVIGRLGTSNKVLNNVYLDLTKDS